MITAYALLTVTAAQARAFHPAPVLPDDTDLRPPIDCGMFALTCPNSSAYCRYSCPAE